MALTCGSACGLTCALTAAAYPAHAQEAPRAEAASQIAAPHQPDTAHQLGTAENNVALKLVARIPIPEMTGTWDHLTVDPVTKRLFLSAQEDNQVRVVDLVARKPLHTMAGGFNRPQGLYYILGISALAVTNGKDGSLRSFDGKSYEPIKTIPLTLGADMMDFDPATRYLYIDHGGTDSNRGPGALAIVDSSNWSKVGEIPTEVRPGSIELEKHGPRLFVTLPGLSQVAVIDRKTARIYARYQLPTPGQPIAMTLDEAHRRMFIAGRRPAAFNVLDMDSGRPVQTLDVIDGVEGIWFDQKLKRIYMSALDGNVQVLQQVDADQYKEIARFHTGHHAGTSQFVPSMNLLCVAVPPIDGQASEVWLFEPKP